MNKIEIRLAKESEDLLRHMMLTIKSLDETLTQFVGIVQRAAAPALTGETSHKAKLLMADLETEKLSGRVSRVLDNAGIRTYYDLVKLQENDFKRYRNLGQRSFVEVRDFLMKKGLFFGMQIEPEILKLLEPEKSI